jgi:AraC-like DNA-binding protein
MDPLDEVCALITRHARSGNTATALDGVKVMASAVLTDPVQVVYEPSVAVVAQGAKRTVLGGRTLDYRSGQYLIVPIELPISGHVIRASKKEPFLAVGLRLQPALIATLLLEAASRARDQPDTGGLKVSHADRDLLEAFARLLRLLDHPEDVAVLRPLIEREILWRLLNNEQGALLRKIGLADGHLTRISRATQWIRTHFAEILRIEDLAHLVGMSATSFHRHFRSVTMMSPLQYQKQIRLQEARARLIAGAQDIAKVGSEVGYDSASQFSREYKRLFGVPPGRDAVRLRMMTRPD